MKAKKNLLFLLLLFSVTVIMVGCTKASSKDSTSDKTKVITTTDFYGDIAKTIGGSAIEVQPIIDSNAQDPHDFEPTTQTAKDVSDADLVISNGLGYDDWINRLEKVSHAKTINIGEDVLKLKSGANPHLWYNLEYMKRAAQAIEMKLSQMLPKKKDLFATNLKKFTSDLDLVMKEVNQLNDGSKFEHKVIYTSEPVFDYAIKNARLKVANPNFESAIEREIDPSAKEIAKMKSSLKNKQVDLFIYNKQVDNPVVQSMVKLAKENEVNVLSVTETKPAKLTYLAWMKDVYQNFATELKD